MEATGVYWRPVRHVLEGHVELILANGQHVRNVPGRRSDVSDPAWLASLLAHGLVRSSFVPPSPIQGLRDLTRTRRQLVREQVRHAQRIQKALEDAKIKLTEKISDVMGMSGRAMVEALIAGETDPAELEKLARPGIRAPREALLEALRGHATEHHRFLLRLHLDQVSACEAAMNRVDARIEEVLVPFRAAAILLTTITGISHLAARMPVAEIGVDMGRLPSPGSLLSWAGVCPRMDESAGKRRSTRIRKGAPLLKPLLVQTAWAAVRQKETCLHAPFRRLKSRRGPKEAIIAAAASVLTAAYFILRDQVPHRELGGDSFDRRDKDAVVRRLCHRIRDLGFEVDVRPAA
jgi:transposase